MTRYSLDQIKSAIRNSWDADTSASGEEWTTDNPALGQCVPSSLILQDFTEGELERLATERNGVRETHYRVILPDGTVEDISGDQYPLGQTFAAAPVEGDLREYVLANENTRRRYAILMGRVCEQLGIVTHETEVV
jgi:hypothetical protein